MNNRTFNSKINKLSTGKLLDLKKINLLSDEEKSELVYHVVRNRGPIVKDLLPENIDMSWLHAMGYLYETRGKHFTFVHTCEQRVR